MPTSLIFTHLLDLAVFLPDALSNEASPALRFGAAGEDLQSLPAGLESRIPYDGINSVS